MTSIKNNIKASDYTPIRTAKPNWSDSGKELPIYRIKLSELHYNEENGRIATWISTYTSNPANQNLMTLDRDDFNTIIEKFIGMANSPESMKNLENDIKKKTQLNPGVVLEDGTIVSGNRRFTALRNLFRKEMDERYEYFECFILPIPKNRQEREYIKLIETKTQFGVVSEEDYNPIDRLVTIYRYLIDEETKIWSIKEYAKKIGIKESEAESLFNRATVMVDYLDYIGKPLAFHEARIKKLDGPINELAMLYKKLQSKPFEWNRIKPYLYSEMSKTGGDRTRKVREAKNTYLKNKPGFEMLLANLYKKQEEVEDKLLRGETVHTERIVNEEGRDVPFVSVDEKVVDKISRETKIVSSREKQYKKASSALDSLGEIEVDVIRHMSYEEKEKLRRTLEKIKAKADLLVGKLD